MSDVSAAVTPAVPVAAPAVEPIVPVSVEAAFGATSDPLAPAAAVVAPAAATPVVEDAVKHPSEVPSLLEEFVKAKDAPAETKPEAKVEAKPADAPKPDTAAEVKPVEAVPVEPVVEAPIEYKFEMPPELKAAPKEMEDFTETLRGIRAAPEIGQKLLDMHASSLKDFAAQYAEQTQRDQLRVFNEYRAENRKRVMADEKIGGAGHQTAMTAIAHTRNVLLSDSKPGTPAYEADVKALDEFMSTTGAGDHPVFLKMLHRASRFIREPVVPTQMAKPTATNGQRPTSSLYAPKPASA